MITQKITSDEMKLALCEHLMQSSNYHVATTEFTNAGGEADVFGLNKSLWRVEFEIKVTRFDLKGELKAIHAVLKDMVPSKRAHKIEKHKIYLGKKPNDTGLHIPNHYYFFVPRILAPFCLMTIKDTPYGLWTYDPKDGIYCEKKAARMHEEPITNDELIAISRRLTYENIALRKKLIK
jgi:hypothetical protein